MSRCISDSAMLIPKPAHRERTPFIPALPEFELAHLIGNLAHDERQALTQIAEAADVLMVEERPWLLVPASRWLIDTLAALNAESEDREPCMDDEENHDWENDLSDYEPDYDDEYDYRNAPRTLAELWPRRASEKRAGTVTIKELDAREAARVFAEQGE